MLRGQRRSAVLGRRRSASGLVPLHGRVVFYGDGIASEGAASGDANAPTIALALMGGRLRGAVGWQQAKSGGDMETTYARRGYTIGQQADLIVICSMGHNPETDGSGAIFGYDPAVNPTLITKWKRNVQAVFDGCPAAKLVVWTTCYSSGGSEPYRAQITAAQQAFVTALGARATLFNAHAVFDPLTMANDGIHPNELGGLALGTALAAVIDPLVAPASRAAILGDTGATADHGANLSATYALPGTSGTKSGTVAPTGAYATGRTLANNLVNGSAVAVAASKDSSPGSYEKQIVALSGTPAARNTVLQYSSANIALTGAAPGDYYEMLCELVVDNGAGGAPAGLHAWGANLGTFAGIGNGAATFGTDRAAPLDIVVRAPPTPIFGASTTAGTIVTTRWSATALTARTILSREIVRRVELSAYAAPLYLGTDGLAGSNHLCRITGTATVGSTLRGDPGKWSGGALDFSGRQWFRDGVAIGGASGWAYVVTSDDSGRTLSFGPNPTNAFGSETTTRSAGLAIA